MTKPEGDTPDLILGTAYGLQPAAVDARTGSLTERPKIESSKRKATGFNWRPTLIIVAVAAVVMLAFAFL